MNLAGIPPEQKPTMAKKLLVDRINNAIANWQRFIPPDTEIKVSRLNKHTDELINSIERAKLEFDRDIDQIKTEQVDDL